jgi:hypothetical protein
MLGVKTVLHSRSDIKICGARWVGSDTIHAPQWILSKHRYGYDCDQR